MAPQPRKVKGFTVVTQCPRGGARLWFPQLRLWERDRAGPGPCPSCSLCTKWEQRPHTHGGWTQREGLHEASGHRPCHLNCPVEFSPCTGRSKREDPAEDLEKLASLCMAGGAVTWGCRCREESGASSEGDTELPYDPAHGLVGMGPRKLNTEP